MVGKSVKSENLPSLLVFHHKITQNRAGGIIRLLLCTMSIKNNLYVSIKMKHCNVTKSSSKMFNSYTRSKLRDSGIVRSPSSTVHRPSSRVQVLVHAPPATFHMVFACHPLLSLLMNQLNRPIREQSVTWNLRFIHARNNGNAWDWLEINPWFTWRSPITRRNVLPVHSRLCMYKLH